MRDKRKKTYLDCILLVVFKDKNQGKHSSVFYIHNNHPLLLVLLLRLLLLAVVVDNNHPLYNIYLVVVVGLVVL